ncbi:hypothetical protein [Corynebacterium aquilae]|uniref:Uncharacterized protein n=1 Tax=Corynebacterium aquilae DSM 44791 TaxID=1431546 RepID=A0A1L7CIN7_9CORY|nr:hypothetical protein [Corynebacterium aquilae]APT85675.1 hypothetical protein CAQU_12215 [Corynebacterium aquilae DSM 44791]
MSNLEKLAKIFNIDPNDDLTKLSIKQVSNDSKMLQTLIKLRKEKFAEISDFATHTGLTEDSIESFENEPVDFSLHFVRVYALGVEAEIAHHVSPISKRQCNELWDRDWARGANNVWSLHATKGGPTKSVTTTKSAGFTTFPMRGKTLTYPETKDAILFRQLLKEFPNPTS